jgi:hypothetical protein
VGRVLRAERGRDRVHVGISAKNGALLRTQVALFSLSFMFLGLTKIFLLITPLPALLFPVAMVPLWASLYVDRRTGSMCAVLLSLFTSSLIVYDPIISVVYLISSCVAALSFKMATRKRNVFLVVSGFLSGLVGALVYVATRDLRRLRSARGSIRPGARWIAASAGGWWPAC